jgi:hypothetical protein
MTKSQSTCNKIKQKRSKLAYHRFVVVAAATGAAALGLV